MDHLESSITLACTTYPYHLSMNSTDISQLVIWAVYGLNYFSLCFQLWCRSRDGSVDPGVIRGTARRHWRTQRQRLHCNSTLLGWIRRNRSWTKVGVAWLAWPYDVIITSLTLSYVPYRRGNPLKLNMETYKELRLLWFHHRIPERISTEMESNRGLLRINWSKM